MKVLEINSLENIQGGNFFESLAVGFCVGWFAANIIHAAAYTNPISGTTALVLDLACLGLGAYEAYK